jgi:hypothetical protein
MWYDTHRTMDRPTCFASQVLDAHVLLRRICPAHFASKGHANTPGREPRFMIPGSESGCCDETGGGATLTGGATVRHIAAWPGQSVSHSTRQVRADGRTSESLGLLFKEFVNSHSRPEYFRRLERDFCARRLKLRCSFSA